MNPIAKIRYKQAAISGDLSQCLKIVKKYALTEDDVKLIGKEMMDEIQTKHGVSEKELSGMVKEKLGEVQEQAKQLKNKEVDKK